MGIFDRRICISSLFTMNITTWLSLILAVIALSTPALSSEPRVVCYYTNWSVYRPGTARFNPQNINPYLCTHLVYAFGGFTKDNTLKPFDKYQDIEKGGYAKFTGLKTYNKNLKTLLAIGGWNEGSSRFSPMVASRDRRKEFVRNAIKFLRQNRFDGLDLDWEYPAFRDGGKPKDRENYSKLVRELREEFEKEAEKTNKPRLLLTMAVPAGIEYIQKGFDVKTLNQYLDWMNLLTYDYHSAFEPAVNHHAPLYPLEEPNEYSVDTELNIDYTIKFYIENGADPNKLVLGIPTYGRSYTLFNPDAVEIGAPADGPGEQGDATREKGYLAYYEICEALKPKAKKREIDSDEESEEDEEDEEWTIMHPNPKAMGPVAFRGNQWVGYDDVEIVKKKAEYVAENGLGGIMFWSIDNDDFRGTCHGKPYPLIESAKEAYIARLGTTDNTVTDKPKSISVSSGNRRKHRPRKQSTTTTTTTTTEKPSTRTNKRGSGSKLTTTTPTWNINTPEPPTTPDPGSDFKCTDEGFFPHPRDCKKYFWCLDSGPSELGIVAHQFTCPSGLFFNKAADSCDFARNVLCKAKAATTKAPTTKAPTTTTSTTTTTTTTRKPIRLSTKSSLLFRTTTTTTTTPEPESEEYEDEEIDDSADVDAEDPKVIKELIELIKKVGGVEQLEKHLHYSDSSVVTDGAITTTPSSFNKKLYQKVLERTRGKSKYNGNSILDSIQNSRRGPQNAGIEPTVDRNVLLRKERPQYTTITRSRPAPNNVQESLESYEEEDEPEQEAVLQNRARAVITETKVGTTTRPLQYVNIRRARPTTLSTSDTADDTASRNALFERAEQYVTVSDAPNSLDVVSSRRENMPEYVTIRRQRPTTEETTTVQYANTNDEEVDTQETALERELSSPSTQPQYTSIVRARSTTLPPPEEPNSPEPTTVLAVQISSLLNVPNPAEETPEVETTATQEVTESVTSTTTSTTAAPSTLPQTSPSSLPARRTILRRRGSTTTTTTTTTSAPTSTTQAGIERRKPFLRRTKATAPPDTTESETITESIETTTNKYTRRGNFRFKSRTDAAKNDIEKQRPFLNGGSTQSERPTRTFLRRRSGANVTTTTASPSTIGSTLPSRRPFRIANRRRPLTPSTTTSSSTTTTSTEPTTINLASEESLQDISDVGDVFEDLTVSPRPVKKIMKVQRRPLATLKEIDDQNPSATNEEERKRQSKKYSSTFKQNQLDDLLRLKTKSSEVETTTADSKTTIDDYSAETALAIAAHQLLSAPIPSIPDFDYESTPSRKTETTQNNRYTSPDYTETFTETKKYPQTYTEPNTQTNTYTESNVRTSTYTQPRTIHLEEFTSTPIYKSTSPDYQTTAFNYQEEYTVPRSTYSNNQPTTAYSQDMSTKITRPEYAAPTIISPGYSGVSTGLSTNRYVTEKFVSAPVQDYGYSTTGYTGLGQDPAHFTREYLLESPVTKTYDDEYQYLSPTTPQTTTRKMIKKTIYRRISTTQRPTSEAYVPPVVTTPKPRRIPSKTTVAPFEKITKSLPNRTYRPIDNYDYYDEGQEKADKYEEGTKVILHTKGRIECLDIGNFPHPTSCKKFISCARLENGSLLGWEYICPKDLSFDPVGGICNWSAGLGCNEKDV